ncbi:hypothetical protein [Neisseria gonorrhoeae]|uniref:hypothetical protein n=1 Tax=Neisseria gonorrhoeae TaxID=485 RepID=UPI001402DDEB|nr:hypothetical protein [Neisseria gonorrhoeae]
MQPCRLQNQHRHAGARFCEMREGAECGGKSDVLPANQSVHAGAFQTASGAAVEKRTAVLGEYPRNAPDLSGKAGKTLWEYPSLPEIEKRVKTQI